VKKRIGIAFTVSAVLAATLFTPKESQAWYRREPATMCTPTNPAGWFVTGGGEVDSLGTPSTGQILVCPFYQDGTAVNGTAESVSVDVFVSSGDTVQAWDCISTIGSGYCDAATSTSTPGFQTIHPSLNYWHTDPNGWAYSFIAVNVSHSSSFYGIVIND
jgi:hypothetical protein